MHNLSNGRILVTGGAGLIGSALIWQLNRLGLTNILVTDRLRASEKWKNLRALRFADYLEADDLLFRLQDAHSPMQEITTVFHLGACSATTETDAAYLIANNYEYTKRLCEAALQQGARFVYASSAATYGSLERDLSETRPLQTLRPLNMYGYSKHMFDCYAAQAGFAEQIVGLKYFNVFGPNESHKAEMRSVVNKAFHQISETGRLSLFKSYRSDFADGCQQRDFLYVKDAVKATLFLAQEDCGGLFNVGSGQPNTWLSLAESIFKAMDKPMAVDFIDMPATLRPKYQYFTCADTGRLRAAGYTDSATRLADAVDDYIRNYLVRDQKLGDEDQAI